MGLTKLWLRPDVDVGITMDMVSMTTVVVAVVVMESNLKQVETTNAWICPSARGDSGPKQWRYFKSLCFPFTKLDPSRSPFLYPSSIRGGLDPSGLGRGGWRGYSLWNGREREKERAPTVVLARNPGYVDESSHPMSSLVTRRAPIDLMAQFWLRSSAEYQA